MGKHTASAQINAPADKVWAIVSDGTRMTQWLSPVGAVEKIEPEGSLAEGSQMEVAIGNLGGAKIKIKTVEVNRSLRWTAGPFLAYMMMMPMKVEFDMQPRGEGTEVTITYKSNPMIAPLMRMMTGLKFADEAPATVAKLKQVAESA